MKKEGKINWNRACQGDLRRLEAVTILLGSHIGLLEFLFCKDRPELRAESTLLLRHSMAFSSGEQVLIRMAIDIWNGEGGIHFNDIYEVLDTRNFINTLKALDFLRGNSLKSEIPMMKFIEALGSQ